MKKLKKFGMLTLSTGLSIGILAPSVGATSFGNEDHSNVKIQIAQTEEIVTKGELIKKFKALFPQFNYLTENDFYMGRGHQFPDDETIRYDLSFQKNIGGKQVYGNIGFIGDQLEIERFYYQPANVADALFPAKVTKEKAKEVAQAFIKKFPESSEYQLDTNLVDYFPDNQILTEPIRYSFSFIRTKNKLPISDQQIQVTVLGNGEVSEFYRNTGSNASPSYDDVAKVLPKNEIISKLKENLSIDLQYSIETDYRTGDRHVKLVYQPTSDVFGIHALSGEWQTMNGFSPEIPKKGKLERVVSQPLGSKQTKFSLGEAKAFAEQLLKIDSDAIKLRIESVDERKNYNGQEVISIHYMYEYRNGGTGTNLELDKHTGEIIQYHDLKNEVLRDQGESQKTGQVLSSKDALNQAVKYLKQYSPSYLHNYVMPSGETYFDEDRGVYHFTFPRVVNDIPVMGDQLSVSVSTDGALLGLNVNQSAIEKWPSTEKVISKEKAQATFFENLSLDLSYTKEGFDQKQSHYHLVYTPKFNKSPYSSLDANTGEWSNSFEKNRPAVSHPWAEKELNHLIQSGIIDVGDVKTFNADSKITKGAALEIIMKSLTQFYIEYYPGQSNTSQSFDNIKPDHPLYQVVERAVTLEVLDKEKATFDLDKRLTREELAVWYIRLLGLEQAAKNQGIYQLKFADAKDVKTENIGYVALAHSLGLLTTNNNKFNPKQEVTYANLAVATTRLAHEVYKKGIHLNY
ncbi:YcdB/YcdC domain-containing protein [Cytobacillus sp. FJAT-53684]|uniref:YcdB/YcdC domain-containing protein n=1 Tax=Cytobacillus mangrovibacter TaxID=3299024 RepID=A0ABW6JXT7_9BACI